MGTRPEPVRPPEKVNLANYRIRRTQILGGLTHEYYIAALPPMPARKNAGHTLNRISEPHNLHWTDGNGRTFRGRSKVLAMLEQAAQAPAEARSIELRDGQIYRWRA